MASLWAVVKCPLAVAAELAISKACTHSSVACGANFRFFDLKMLALMASEANVVTKMGTFDQWEDMGA